MVNFIIIRWRKYNFLFTELVKRDFKKKYKRTVLGIFWSMLGPLLHLLVMALIFTRFFGRNTQHYIIYLFAGVLIYSYFKESTNSGMQSLVANSGIFTKIKVPKYLFLFSRNVSSLINFGLTLILFFIFAAIDGVAFHPRFLLLIFPVICLLMFNIGVGLILSALFVFFKDIQYLYDIFTLLLMYLSAIFYTVDSFSYGAQQFFMLNPVYAYIFYFRTIVLHGIVPSLNVHIICVGYALISLALGSWFYKRYNYRFLYYM